MDEQSLDEVDLESQDQYQKQLRAAAYKVQKEVHAGDRNSVSSSVPEAAIYDAPSPAHDTRPRFRRTVQDRVIEPDVVELDHQGADGEEGVRVAVPGVRNIWGFPDESHAAIGETSFTQTPPPKESLEPHDSRTETSSDGGHRRRSWPPHTSNEDDMDSYNGNELGPPPSYASVVEGSGAHSRNEGAGVRDIQLRNLSVQDLADLNNGNAPEFEHMRQDSEEAVPATEPTVHVTGHSRESGGPFPGIWKKIKNNRAKAIVITCVVVSLAALFLLTFPLSFVYVEHHELALRKSRATGVVYTDTVYHPGCYVLGPDIELVRVPGSAHFVELKQFQVHTKDRLAFKLSATLQYFIIPEKLGKLYGMFTTQYGPVFEKVFISTIQNEGSIFSLDDFRFRRTYIEKYLHSALKTRFQGNCCPSCCPSSCDDDNVCSACVPSHSCNTGYPIDIRYFQLGQVDIPIDITERFLKRSILKVESEAEKLKLQEAVIAKETDRKVKQIENQAAEILANATVRGNYIRTLATIESEAKATRALQTGLRAMCAKLNITKEEHKMSMYMIRTIEDSKKIYVSPDFSMRSAWVQA